MERMQRFLVSQSDDSETINRPTQGECALKQVALEQVALAWARAARVSTGEMQLAAWRDAAHAEVRRSS